MPKEKEYKTIYKVAITREEQYFDLAHASGEYVGLG